MDQINLDQLVPPQGQSVNSVIPGQELPKEIGYFQNLPNLSESELVGSIIQIVLKSTFYLALVAIVIAGIYYLISQGNDEDAGKAKKILLYIAIGSAIISAAYGIVSGLIRFNVF